MTDLTADGRALKTLTHALIEAVGGTNAAQILLGHRSPSTVSAYGSMSFPDRFMPTDDVVTLERHAQQPIVSAWMAERPGAEPQPSPVALSLDAIVGMAKEGSEAKLAIVAALADGNVDAADRINVARELREAISTYTDILRAVEFPS